MVSLAACTGTADPNPSATSTTVVHRPVPFPTAVHALVAFDACDDLVDWAVDHAIDRVGPYGLDGYYGYPYLAFAEDGVIGTAESGAPTGAGDRAQFSSDVLNTNLQELGVDEPDLVKTDGRRIVALTGSRLQIVLIDGDELTLAGSLDLGSWSQTMFLDGDRVLVIAGNQAFPIPVAAEPVLEDELISPIRVPYTPVVTVAEIDISDPSDPELVRSLQIDGRYVSSRIVDGSIRLVISSFPTGFAWSYPEGGGLRSEREAEHANRELVRNSTADNWLPFYTVTDYEGKDRTVAEGTLLECSRTHRPDEFSGLTTLSLVTLDPDQLLIDDATGVFADGDIVYSSSDAAYVATSRWIDPIVWEGGGAPETQTQTQVHKFSLEPNSAEYEASGAVPGFMLSQWSMSEFEGDLRVASTTSPQWWDGPDSESMVTVLRQNGDELEAIGSVDGLGKGERIYSVRFMGDRGYVVTFRQVDPLYVLDLSDPRNPSVEGELKIPGYSAYLHPIGDDHLLGIGQDADLDGRVNGLQASLFDVGSPEDPDRVDQFFMKDAHSELEWDHHAFLYDPISGIAVFPFQRWVEKASGPNAGAVVLEVRGEGIDEVGAITHDDHSGQRWHPPIRRSFIIGGNLVTVSDAGVMITEMSPGLETLDWVGF
jgi:hypothetical protein